MLAGAQADDPAEIESARAALTAAEEELERDQKEEAALGLAPKSSEVRRADMIVACSSEPDLMKCHDGVGLACAH